MKISNSRRISAAAFSLVEVALALGVAGFCLIAVVGLVPLGVSTGQIASDQAAASSIITHVLADLRSAPVTSPPGAASVNSEEYAITIPANTTGGTTASKTLYFGGTDRQFSIAAVPASARYRLTVTFPPPTVAGRTATPVTLLVSWPAQIDPTNAASGRPTGRVQVSAALDRN